MSFINPITSQSPYNTATLTTTGGLQLATGGGYIAAPLTVQAAGSADAVLTLYDGTSSSGIPLATFSLAAGGPLVMPNTCFGTGLFANVTGTTAGQVLIAFTGAAQ